MEDLGHSYAPQGSRVPVYGRYANSDPGGSTSVRRNATAELIWKDKGYYQRNRDLGQVFNVPDGETLQLGAVVLRTGNSRSAVLTGTPGAPVYLQLFEVVGEPVINDNGTPVGTPAAHGYTDNHRADDYLEGVTYRPLRTFFGGNFPELEPTTENGGQPGHLRYLRWRLGEPVVLAGDRRYAFLVGFAEDGVGYGFTLGNNNLAGDPAAPALRTDAAGLQRWSIRREGNGTTPPTKIPGSDPPADPKTKRQLLTESRFAAGHYDDLRPTSNGFPDVDTYRCFEFYLEAAPR